MEHKNTDCYFFYYSTCKKGDHCPFRHEPSALGCETMCSYWQQGNCLNEHCSFRHMELKKNRKSIPCYWETQPSGCRKPYCPFLHKNARTICDPINPVKTTDITSKPFNQEWVNRQDDTKYDTSSAESDQGRGSSEAGSFIGSPAVDPLIVKFEEESDNESVPSPIKTQPQPRVPYCKTYEEIRLEEIQAESAAYYSYEAGDRTRENQGKVRSTKTIASTPTSTSTTTTSVHANDVDQDKSVDKMRRVIVARDNKKVRAYKKVESKSDDSTCSDKKKEATNELDFKVLTLEEIRRRKKRKLLLDDDIGEFEEEISKTIKTITDSKDWNVVDEFSKDTVKSRAVVRATSLQSSTPRGIKRSLEQDKDAEKSESERNVKSKSYDDVKNRVAKVPPVRLRRSPKRFSKNIIDEESIVSRQQTLAKMFDENVESSLEDAMKDEELENEEDDLESENLDVRVKVRDDSSISARKNEVEVRLCDSSTGEERMRTDDGLSAIQERKDNEKSILMDTVIDDSKASRLSCDSLLAINEDEYLMLDTASDDILKDIDALLKDKSVV